MAVRNYLKQLLIVIFLITMPGLLALFAGGLSSYSNFSSTATSSGSSAAVVSAIAGNDGSMTLNWNNNFPGASNFLIEESTNGGSNWSTVTTAVSTNSYLIAATNYPTLAVYRVTAQNAGTNAPRGDAFQRTRSLCTDRHGPGRGRFYQCKRTGRL